MTLTKQTGKNADAVTQALWCAAEAGEFDEVMAMLARVADINARNEHGVTALMRAAQRGHARVVRLLLAHGADANVIRNDKFTALSLAAFFGHTEVVRVLMEHGADSQAGTRHETSPHMWAKARTFSEVVNQLETPAAPAERSPERTPEREARPSASRPISAPVLALARKAAEVREGPQVVRTLHDPPEIWDLVHEAPSGFNARSAFVTRLRSMTLTFRIATAAGLIGACVVGVLVLRGVHARGETTFEHEPKPVTPVVKVQPGKTTIDNTVPPATTASAVAPSSSVTPSVAPDVTHESPTAATRDFKSTAARRRNSHSQVVHSSAVEAPLPPQPAMSESAQKLAAPPEISETKVRSNSTTQTKSSSPLSPQLITPAKNVSPKSKVIQWP